MKIFVYTGAVNVMFAKSLTNDMKSLDPLFGPEALTYLSIDDKARVPLGLAAANLQSPILMHLEYKVRLNDHDFVVGGRRHLTNVRVVPRLLLQQGDVAFCAGRWSRCADERKSQGAADEEASGFARPVGEEEARGLATSG